MRGILVDLWPCGVFLPRLMGGGGKGMRTTASFRSVLLCVLATAGAPALAQPGAVYTMTNAASGNEVVALHRAVDGTLSLQASYPTGGNGTGAGLGSQGAVLLTPDERYLLALNAGSDSITVFRVLEGSLERLATYTTGARKPVSVTVHSNLLYVLHAGGDVGARDLVTGFGLFDDGRLARIPGVSAPLSARSTSPAQISFVQEGKVLVVTEKATNRIDTFVLRPNNHLSGPIVHDSAGATPFGFAEGERDQIIVSEAANGTVSTYRVGRLGSSRSWKARSPRPRPLHAGSPFLPELASPTRPTREATPPRVLPWPFPVISRSWMPTG